ncbi:kelch-like protein 1 isoform X2 [Hibiscus syriacus]|uniref:kelch-like protein 1 isoform X2 n=1 Tax=Hibiscus syriacus TaxID=106335 RepID=UPI0019214833|nr:kelch-like protein 1 isoform X2 [Hibiscus syriacus]
MMVAGRKQQTFIANGNVPFTPNEANTSVVSRNLRKNQLGGVIFGCKNATYKECLFKQLFGLPAQHFSYVKNIDPGLPLFLFNYSERKLHGIFEAASHGQMNINPYGWTTDGSEKTQYPAQVQIRVRQQCQPLLEEQFKPIIADNYYCRNHFWFELDHVQTSKLVSLLASLAVSPSTYLPHNAAKWRNIFQPLPSSGTKMEDEGFRPLAPVVEHANHTNAKWDRDVFVDETKVADEHFSQSSGKSDATDFTPFDPLETNVDAKTTTHGEKEFILIKLQELAQKRTEQDVSLMDNVEDSMVMKEAHLVQKKENGACSSSSCQSSIAKFIQGMEELRTFKTEQCEKMIQMEQKLVAAEMEIQRLKDRCLILESLSNQSVEHINVKEIDTSDELQLDPTKSIFLVGGYNGALWSSALDSYFPSHDVIKSVQPMSSVRSYTSVVQLNGEFYVFGGGDGFSWYDTVESYNPSSNQWTPGPSLKQPKGSLAGAALDDKIFAIGGGNGIQCFSDVEMLDLNVGRWINTRSMLQKRFALAAVELNGAIYATGGYDGSDYLKSAERFDPREHSWTKIAGMSTKRGCHSLVVFNENLYAIGGYDGTEMVPSVEIFDMRMGSWMIGEPINQARGYAAAAVVDGSIYVIGGLRAGEDIVDLVECMEAGGGWQVKSSKAVGKRCFLSAVVLKS